MSPPGDYFTFNQPNIKYLYVICCFYTLGLADSKKFHHVCKFIFAIIFAIMLTCNFFARNQQKHHLAVESWSFKEAATFGSRSTEEFCATRGILRAPFCILATMFDLRTVNSLAVRRQAFGLFSWIQLDCDWQTKLAVLSVQLQYK